MAGNPEPVIDLEEDDEEEEEEGMNIKREVDAESASESGVPLGKPEGSADKEPKKVADPKDDQPGGQGSLRKTSPDVRAADVTAEDGEQKSASREPEGAQRKDSDCACVCCWSSASGKHKNEIISSRTRTRRTPHEIQLKTASARAAKKLEATDLLACDKCDFKTSKQGVMARHIKAHAGYVPCACNFCDFKCRGIRVLDKHVIENHLDEMNLKKGKNKRNARRGKKGVEVLPSSLVPYRTIPHLYDPIAIRHRKKKVKNIDKSGDPHPATVEKAPPSSEVGSHCSGSTEPAHSTNGLEETPTLHTENTAAQDRLTCNTNVAATKNPASLDSKERHCVFCSFVCGGVVELEEHVKIHTSSAARPENGFKPKATDLPRSNHSPQVNSGVDLPPKNKVNPSGKRFKLDDLLKEKLSAILTAAAQSTAVTSEKEMSEHAETSAESQPSKSNARTKKSAETPAKKLFSCEICDYETHTRPQFGRHMKTHSGKKTYSCDFCDFKGKGIQGLKKHMMVHTPSVVIRNWKITAARDFAGSSSGEPEGKDESKEKCATVTVDDMDEADDECPLVIVDDKADDECPTVNVDDVNEADDECLTVNVDEADDECSLVVVDDMDEADDECLTVNEDEADDEYPTVIVDDVDDLDEADDECPTVNVDEADDECPTVIVDDVDEVDDGGTSYVPSGKSTEPAGKRKWTRRKQQPKTRDNAQDIDPLEESSLRRKKVKIEDKGLYEVYTFEALDDIAKIADTKRPEAVTSPKKTYACTLCDFKCVKSKYLTTHMRTHTGEKPYACTVCDYKSAQYSNLRTHMRVHTKEKPYKCELCDFSCTQGNNLKRHMQTHTGETSYECAVCGYKCIQANDLKRHVRCHTGEKPYACDLCDYKCIQSVTLKAHKKNNHEKTYACSSCDYKCTRKSQLNSHEKIHSKKKYYSCDLCDYKSYKPGDLEVHRLKLSHNKLRIGKHYVACDICRFQCSRAVDLYKHLKIHAKEKVLGDKRVKVPLPKQPS